MKIICSVTDKKPFVACGFCGVKISPVITCDWLHHNKHSRHILGVHANMITAVIAALVVVGV